MGKWEAFVVIMPERGERESERERERRESDRQADRQREWEQ